MHNQITSDNPCHVATHFRDPHFVSHALSFHQSAALDAANMVRLQYAKVSKASFRRECLDHLKASLVHENGALV
jgi:hypothetical protein